MSASQVIIRRKGCAIFVDDIAYVHSVRMFADRNDIVRGDQIGHLDSKTFGNFLLFLLFYIVKNFSELVC